MRKAPNNLLGEYINYYAATNSSWQRFKDILWLDFDPAFIRMVTEESIRKVFELKKTLATEKRIKYNRVA